MTRIFVSMLFIFCLFNFSCKQQQQAGRLTSDTVEERDTLHLAVSVKNIFYSIPTPIETVFLIKNSGVLFEKEILNPITYLQQYTTSKQKATNLGIYSLDMCYSSLNHQRDQLIAYLNGVKKISSDLGILADFDHLAVEDIEQHIDDQDYVFKQISDRFLKNTRQQTLERKIAGAYIMVGSFIEGLYITLHHATRLVSPDQGLQNCLIQHGLSLSKIQTLLDEMQFNELKPIQLELKSIAEVLSKFKTKSADQVHEQTGDEQLVVMDAYKTVKKLRNSYVN